MSNGTIFCNDGLKVMLNRFFKAVPDYTAPSLFAVGTGTNTPVVTDSDLQTPVDITTGVQTKVFVSGYPTLDETNLQGRVRMFLNSLEANGNSISEVGIKNSDATKKLIARSVFTAISKTAATEVSFVWVFKQ